MENLNNVINRLDLIYRTLIPATENYTFFSSLCVTISNINYEFRYKAIPGGSDGTESPCNAGDLGSIPGLGKSPREGNGYPLQYSGLENSMDRGAWQATVHGVAKSWVQLRN